MSKQDEFDGGIKSTGSAPATVDSQTRGSAPNLDARKSIVLFSDGTGNSSGKLFKTNVWRMYEAVDLGPSKDGDPKQIAFYDDGVGTSTFKPLALLGGVFGFGLKRNVLDIYRYACRNYSPGSKDARGRLRPGDRPGQNGIPDLGDEIYGFGFSRGAFTMRIAIAMIAKIGLAITTDEAELQRRSEEAWRIFRADYKPRIWQSLATWWRRRVGHRQEREDKPADVLAAEQARNYHPIIRFIGVWDTVAAYGGPITEVTSAIDDWIYRLSMPDYELADSVRRARHALAIDDERDSFHPLLWDEHYEKRAIAAAGEGVKPEWIDTERLEQVWFSGMHSDVGGGYPDESLSYVSFLWMLEEAMKVGLRISPVMVERYRALANSAGPIHNSRSGISSYYRYQPRRIAVWMDPIHPEIGHRRDREQIEGLIDTVKVHGSVAARIASGTDRYAPIGLAAPIRVVPPQALGENSSAEVEPVLESGSSGEEATKPLISKDMHERFENDAQNATRIAAMREIWSHVRRRRVAYYISLFLTLVLLSMPLWGDSVPEPPFAAGGHGLFGSIVAVLSAVLPGFLAAVVESWASHPFYVIFLAALLILSNSRASKIERKLRDDTRHIWTQSLDVERPAGAAIIRRGSEEAYPLPDRLAKVPAGTTFQKLRRFFHWHIAPFLIFLLLMAVAVWLALAVATRGILAVQERTTLCRASAGPVAATASTAFQFSTDATCSPANFKVEKGKRYLVEVDVTGRWCDGGVPTDPRGLAASELPWGAGYLGMPFRRVVNARYLQPVVHIRSNGWGGPALQPLELEQRSTLLTQWRGEFIAQRSGALSIFANDSVMPFPGVDYFYTNNRGTATIRVNRVDALPQPVSRLQESQ